jgi:hypothetical protein
MHISLSGTSLLLAGMLSSMFMASTASGLNTSDRVYELENYHGYYPCSDCHSDQETNPNPRFLLDEHYEPLEWEDSTETVRYMEFGEWISFADLLNKGDMTGRQKEAIASIGQTLETADYMLENDAADSDSIWVLTHGGANLWCLDCHDATDRDKLVKLKGGTLGFNESQFLCGQCHGPILEDWESGLHGRTNGYWNLAMDEDNLSVRQLCVDCHNPHAPNFRSQMPMGGPISRIDNLEQSPVGHHAPHGSHDELGPHPWIEGFVPSTSDDHGHDDHEGHDHSNGGNHEHGEGE